MSLDPITDEVLENKAKERLLEFLSEVEVNILLTYGLKECALDAREYWLWLLIAPHSQVKEWFHRIWPR